MLVLAVGLLALMTGCQALSPEHKATMLRMEQNRVSHAFFRQQTNWKRNTFRDPELLAESTPNNTHLEVALEDQRALLLVNDLIALDFPIATGKRSHPTPAGQYKVINKKRHHASNLYGKFVDSETGETVQRDVDMRRNAVPDGARFVGSPMPYWIRLTNAGVGLHVGDLPGYPASHGCVRMPRSTAPDVFSRVDPGSRVVVAPQAPVIERYAAMSEGN